MRRPRQSRCGKRWGRGTVNGRCVIWCRCCGGPRWMKQLLRPAFLKTLRKAQRNASLQDERGQQSGLMFEFFEGRQHGIEQLVHVCRAEVAQLAILGPTPDPLVGVVL